MDFDHFTQVSGTIFQVSALDLLLSGDNALVIAMACLSLPAPVRARAVLLGTVLAIALRVVLTGIVGFILQIPLLKLLGAVMLLAIAIRLLLQVTHDETVAPGPPAANQLAQAVMLVVTADLALSLDNVVAVAAAAQGSWTFMALGLMLSMPLLMYGSLMLSRVFDQYPLLVPAGSALLAWIAGQIAVSDPWLADWVNMQAPALTVVAPALCVVFVLLESRIIRRQRLTLTAPPPLRLPGWPGAWLTGAQGVTPDQPAAPEPVVADQVSMREPVYTAADSVDPAEQSRVLALGLKALLFLSVLGGALALGWILLHLLSQGVLPPPAHSGY